MAQDKAEADVALSRSKKWPVPNFGVGYRHYESTDQDTWDFVFTEKCPVLLGVQVDGFFAGPDDWSISTSEDESIDDVVMVLFHHVIPEQTGQEDDAEVNL